MIYFRLSGTPTTDYCVFYRDTNGPFPFISTLYVGNGSRNNVQSWKTENGAIKAIQRIFPEWVLETSEEYMQRQKDYKLKQ